MIKLLHIHNFRCFENFDLKMEDLPSVLLIGRNGSGKSTVASVLEILQSIARGTNRVGQLIKPSDFSGGRTEIPMRFEINVEIEKKIYQYTLVLELPEGFKELRVAEEKLTVSGNPVYSREDAQVQLIRTQSNNAAQFLVDWHLIALPVIQEQSFQDPLFIFKTWLSRMLILAPIPRQIAGDSDGETLVPNQEVEDFGAWFSGLLAYSPAAYTHIDQYLRSVMPDFKDIKNPVIGATSRTLNVQFQQDQALLSLPFRALSDGEKCFFICAAVLAANDAYTPLFCFWDEPDIYLSFSEVGHFVATLRRAFQKGGQLMISSHNIEAIRQFSDENTLVLYRSSHLEPTRIEFLKGRLTAQNIKGSLEDALLRGDILF